MDADEELDIVEELRFFAEASETDGITVAMLSGCIFADAADEIERLRSEIGTSGPIDEDLDVKPHDSSVNVNNHADPSKCLHTRCEDLTLARELEIKHLRSMVTYWCNAEERLDGLQSDYYENAAYALDKLRKLVKS